MSRDFLDSTHGRSPLIFIFVLSGLLIVSWFLLTGDVGLSLMDEGSLWYDTHRTVHGDVPMRDFKSYDPGRYYWGAGWAMILGEGVLGLRISNAIFQWVGLLLGLLIARRVINGKRGLVLVGILLLLWMYPRYKLFEYTLEIGALFFAVRLIEEPHPNRYFQAGAMVGLAAFFGLHLGLFFWAGFSCLILFLELQAGIRRNASRYGIWGTGVVVGYMPMILMFICVPNFAASFADYIARLVGPYIPEPFLPIPFPWEFSYSQISSLADVERPVLGCALLLAVVFYLSGIWKVFSLKHNPPRSASVLTASVFLGIPLVFYFLIRADLEHFALSSMPLLFGLLGFRGVAIACKERWTAILASLTLVSLALVAVSFSPEVTLTTEKVSAMLLGKKTVVKYRVLDDTVWIPQSQAQYLDFVKQLVADRIEPDQGILIAPYQPGLYRILQVESPIWDPYPIHPAPGEEEERAIEDLQSKNIQWALLSNGPLDNFHERRFSRTHPRIWNYLNEHFVPVYVGWMPDDEQLMRRSVTEVVASDPKLFEEQRLSERLATLAKRRGHQDRAAWEELKSIYENRQKMKWISRSAEGGDPIAQFHTGLAHQKGAGVFKNFREAAEWYRKAADQGYAVAQTSLGFMYVMGSGVPQDAEEAVKWYRKAGDQGEPVAQTCLGNMYEKGEGVANDLEEAVKWYRKASDQGYQPAQQALGRLLKARTLATPEP